MSAASGGNSEPKQGQRSQNARGFCPRSTMRVPQPDIIEHFGNADAMPQLPERCLSRKAGIVRCCLFFLFNLVPKLHIFHKFPLKLLANGVICNTWYSSCSKPPPVYPGILLAPPAAKSCLQDTTRSAKSQPDSLHRPVFCKILLQGFAPPTIMYLYIISKGAWHSRFPGLPGALDSKQKGGPPDASHCRGG